MRAPWGVALAMVLVALASTGAGAAERILDYQGEIEVHADATMTVSETIAVQAEGNMIRRGIFRDFPTDYRDRYGNRYRVGFEVLEVRRNGQPEPWHTERRSNGVRVYAGSADRRLEPGRHEYVIRYRTDRQLGFFDDHDELYWNVTGTGWDLPIDAARALVRLPDSVPADAIRATAFTGPQGSREQAYEAGLEGQSVRIAAGRPLGPREGLTIVVSWPKGHVDEPTAEERLGWLLRDNRGLLLAGSGLLVVLGYLGWAWRRYGLDPPRGVIFPHYEPPGGYSPASARFISRMGYDNRAFVAAVVNLAVKGHVEIFESDGDYTLQRASSGEALAAGEKALLAALFEDGPKVELEQDNHRLLAGAKQAHRKALKRDYEKIYFITNGTLLLPAAGAILGLGIAVGLLEAWRPLVFVLFGLMIAALPLFYWLLRAPTARGRRLMDKLEGFKSYLEVAEKDELNLRNPPEKTPELFERYLPFALALGVEQAWAEKFAAVFARLEAGRDRAWRPGWYHGHFNARSLGTFTSGVGASLTSAIASASTAPGSSSGGGGFSGGGGGGGGGGGW
ncbi:DUF2207 domain-containing protein [Thioalkalivibrio sp. XN8]|uniref:DUF2207 domain-containing protein n=1 Tax=Thioalkalivibrio sp. XN8 TaxID=2712863 RepID=UPI0013E9E5F8|nr:DUF2207 domain-containing protein [Thioalkalivibrio sp. XN8]NGP52103.1 DUF2207 domain-containing protein [Thioalkalivibrio sp. XN8]